MICQCFTHTHPCTFRRPKKIWLSTPLLCSFLSLLKTQLFFLSEIIWVLGRGKSLRGPNLVHMWLFDSIYFGQIQHYLNLMSTLSWCKINELLDHDSDHLQFTASLKWLKMDRLYFSLTLWLGCKYSKCTTLQNLKKTLTFEWFWYASVIQALPASLLVFN